MNIETVCDCGGILVNHKGNEYEPDEIACIDCDKDYGLRGNTNKNITKARQKTWDSYLKEEEKEIKKRRYVNRILSERIVRSDERDVYDYKVLIKETGAEIRSFHIAISKKQKKAPYYYMSISGVKGTHDIPNLQNAKKIQDIIVSKLKQGINVDVVINGGW